MSDRGSLENLKQEIVENIYTNENQAVTGDLLQDVLIDAVDTMGVSVSQNTLSIGGEDKGELAGQLIENPEWIWVVTDSGNKILFGFHKTDGSPYFGYGCPPQVVKYVSRQLGTFTASDYDAIKTFLGNLVDGDTLTTLLNAKVDKVSGKSLISSDIAENTEYIENPEWIDVKVDSNKKVLEGIDVNGVKKILLPLEANDATFNGKIRNKDTKHTGFNDVLYKEGFLPYVSGDFNIDLDKEQLVELYNSKLEDYCELNKCHTEGMYALSVSDTDKTIYWKINHNFREDVVYEGISKELLMSQLNKYFNIEIHRFDCAFPNASNNVKASIKILPQEADYVNLSDDNAHSFKCVYSNIGHRPTTDGWVAPNQRYWEVVERNNSYPIWDAGTSYKCAYTLAFEPSALISDDRQKIELFSGGGKRFDFNGLTWEKKNLTFDQYEPLYHPSCNKVDGKYLWLAPVTNGTTSIIGLYESSDGLAFEFKGFMKGTAEGDDIGNGQSFSALGNSYLFKTNDGIYYLFLEGTAGNGWEITVRTCTDIFYDNGDGTIGNWIASSQNPILPAVLQGQSNKGLHNYYNTTFCPGNPEILKGEDNQPIRINGKYYMIFHGCYNDSIEKAYSYDLINWTWEGNILNQRDIPDGGWTHGDVTDHALCQFKGRTYLFYTHNINSYGYSCENIRYQIDDRPLSEIVNIKI